MPLQQRRPQKPAQASKQNVQATTKSLPARTPPATLDDKALRQVAGGGSTSLPHGLW
jgi:hypothetical protein